MKEKILKFILVSILLLVLLASDFILLGHGVAVAVYEELETQGMTTNVKNVEFDSYFLDNGNKTHSKQNNLTQEEILVLNINVKEQGVLNDAKIKIENANFEIQKDKIQNTYVKNINLETNEIELNQIIYGNNVTIELPIKFKKQTTFAEDYFEMENTISLTGIYKAESEKEVLGQIKTRMIWTEEVDTALSEEIEKYIDLGENGVLLQQKVVSEIIDDKLPRQNETLTLQVPEIEEKVPESVVVLLNGNKLSEENVNYTKDTKSLVITSTSNGVWEKARNEYKVIYQYNDITFETKTIELNATLLTNIYTKGNLEKTDSQTIEISKTGNVVSISKAVSNSIYKGFMYANVENETTYKESNRIEISDIVSVENIEITKDQEVFLDENSNEFDANEVSIYKTTQISKATFQEIFGIDGILTIKDINNNVLATINNETETDADGNITINYEAEVNNLKIEVSKPISQGTLTINNIRAIKGITGYSKKQLKQFQILSSSTKVETKQGEEIAEGKTQLLDSRTEANIQLDKKELSTLNTNENIQIILTMKNNSSEYDLYKNSYIEVELPEVIENIDIKQINKLYDEELEIKNPKLFTRDGKKVISMELSGSQTVFNEAEIEGTQLMINADITLKKETATSVQSIYLNYTNQNGEEDSYQSIANFTAKSKYGVMAYRKITGISNLPIEEYDNKTMVAELNIQDNEKIVNIEQNFINNYEENVENFVSVTKLAEESDSFHTTLTGPIISNMENTKIYYLVNNNWCEEVSDYSQVEAYKIEYKNDNLLAGEMLKISYQIKIPGGLEYEKENNELTNATYTYKGQENTIEFSTKYKTVISSYKNEIISLLEENEAEGYQEVEGIGKVKVTAMSAGKILEDGEEVYEGQTIKYIVEVINDTAVSLNDFEIIAKHTNAIFYDKKVTIGEDTATLEETTFTEIIQNPDLEQKEYKQQIVESGEKVKFEYEFLVKENATQTMGNIEFYANSTKRVIDTIQNKVKEAKLQIITTFSHNEEFDIKTGETFSALYQLKNLSEQEIKDMVLEVKIPENCTLREDVIQAGTNVENENALNGIESTQIGAELLSNDGKVAKIKIEKVDLEKETLLSVTFNVGTLSYDVSSLPICLYATATIDGDNYYSNIVEKEIKQTRTEIKLSQVGSIQKEEVQDGEILIYKTTIENKGILDASFIIHDAVPAPAVITKAYIIKNGVATQINQENIINNTINFAYDLPTNEKAEVYIETKIDITKANEEAISNVLYLSGPGIAMESNKVTYKINAFQTKPSAGSISGIVWLDENQDGERQANEKTMNDMTVELLTAQGEKIQTVTTNQIGKYTFSGLKNGNYLVIFKYDTKKYAVTEYKKDNVVDYLNSDVISKQINGQTVASTDIIKIEDDGKQIDAGFIESKIFDFRLDKYVSSITLENKSSTKVYSFDRATLAKVEVNAKTINGTKLNIEYIIEVTNEGEIEGYIEDIVDYLPEGMTVASTNWTQDSSDELHNRTLANEIIKPGETRQVKLVLTKTLTENDTGTIINTAEIAKSNNTKSISDIDSIAGNRNGTEDDYGKADVIISIGTGLAVTISIAVVGIVLIVIAGGIYYIRRREREKNE